MFLAESIFQNFQLKLNKIKKCLELSSQKSLRKDCVFGATATFYDDLINFQEDLKNLYFLKPNYSKEMKLPID